MTDRGERRVRRWALRRNGDPLEPRDVAELVFEMDEDHADDMKEIRALIGGLKQELGELRGRVVLHHEWADSELKPAVAQLRAEVDGVLGEPSHAVMHAEHMRDYHPMEPRREGDDPSEHFCDQRTAVLPELTIQQVGLLQILAGWSLLKKLLVVALTAVVIGAVGIGVTYVGSYFAADRVEQVEIEQHKTPTPVITITVSPSP